MQSVCVYCGSSAGRQAEYRQGARELADALVDRGIRLVYGGASVGLMGEMADQVLARGGKAIGVMPQGLVDREVAHQGLSELKVVGSMHERKAMMAELSDGFIAMPGGLGTLEELFEILTWSQLGIHQKPCGLLNVRGYYDGLLGFLNLAVSEQFIRSRHRQLLITDSAAEPLLNVMAAYQSPIEHRWLEANQA